MGRARADTRGLLSGRVRALRAGGRRGDDTIENPIEDIRQLAVRDGRYSPEAFHFLFQGLQAAIALAGKDEAEGVDRHVSGQELLAGMRSHALEQFGPLAAQVWRSWGVHETLDWGRIVFLLVENGLLNRQDSDTLEDFEQGFDFDEAFVAGYRPVLPDGDDTFPDDEDVE